MAADQSWVSRLLALELASTALPPEKRMEIPAGMAERDTDEVVNAYAQATVELLKNPPTTQPAGATQPAQPPAVQPSPSEPTPAAPTEPPAPESGSAPTTDAPAPNP